MDARLTMRLLGVDYGREGAIAVMEGPTWADLRLAHVGDLYRGIKTDIPQVPLSDLRGVSAFVEDFMLRYARTVEREACIRYGMLLEGLRSRGAIIYRVRPHDWKRSVGLPTSKDQKERKNMSQELARKLFPHVRFDRADLADAALIAEHGRLVLLGGA